MKTKEIVKLALEEDIGTGDITTEYLDLPKKKSVAYFIAKQDGVLCGLNIAFLTFKTVDESVKCVAYKKDGDSIKLGESIAKIEGYSSSILMGERVALNFLQRLSGIATMTKLFSYKIKDYPVKLLDTRKTTPLLRGLEKYAVKVGGGYNHRFGLYDMILIKENHIRAAGGITRAVELVKKSNTTYKIEVEVTNLKELAEAVKCKVDRVMLDNMPPSTISKGIEKYSGLVEFEASGNVSFESIEQIAATGVNYISSGALTHSYKSLDISLLFSVE